MNSVAVYKINIGKSVAFLHTNNETSERKIKKTFPLIIALKPIYLGINLPEEVKNLYTENEKILMKEIEDPKKCKSKTTVTCHHTPVFFVKKTKDAKC